MDIGLYQVKYPFRKLIRFLLPLFKHSNPNWISLALLPVGLLMAWCYWQALAQHQNAYLLYAILLGFLRMVVATLDGLVAVTYSKSTTVGDILNRITPELCDLLLYPTILLALQRFDGLALGVLTISWAICFFGMQGAASGCPVQSVGPCGQTDRLAALLAFSGLQFLSLHFGWAVDFMTYFFLWILVGGSLTVVLRLQRTLKAAREKDASPTESSP